MKMLVGKVVSKKMSKTIVVEVVRQRMHPLYKKMLHSSKRYKVHCIDESVKEGDIVKIVSVSPISKEKHFRLDSKLLK